VVKGGGSALSPEVVDTYEIVWIQAKADWRYRISTYQSKIKDSITIDGSSDPDFILEYQNNVAAESYGVEVETIYQGRACQAYANVSWNGSKQTAPTLDRSAYSAYPDLAANAGITYHVNSALAMAMHNVVYDGFKTINPGTAVAPSYVDNGPLPTLWRTDVQVSWAPPKMGNIGEIYLIVRDLFDRQDMSASMTPLEYGSGMPGRRLVLGARMAF
jgi:outer membrane receptor protein involved in Fe transport